MEEEGREGGSQRRRRKVGGGRLRPFVVIFAFLPGGLSVLL